MTYLCSRRRLLQATLALIPATVLAQDKRVDENEPQAKALGYRLDAAKIDKAKYPSHQPGQSCANCNFFKGNAQDAWGPCEIFSGRQVNAKGWCTAWAKKP